MLYIFIDIDTYIYCFAERFCDYVKVFMNLFIYLFFALFANLSNEYFGKNEFRKCKKNDIQYLGDSGVQCCFRMPKN